MRSYTVVSNNPAVADLVRIQEHIRQDNPAAANQITVQPAGDRRDQATSHMISGVPV